MAVLQPSALQLFQRRARQKKAAREGGLFGY
jgi:hypothetical protein